MKPGVHREDNNELGIHIISFDNPVNTIPSDSLINGEYLSSTVPIKSKVGSSSTKQFDITKYMTINANEPSNLPVFKALTIGTTSTTTTNSPNKQASIIEQIINSISAINTTATPEKQTKSTTIDNKSTRDSAILKLAEVDITKDKKRSTTQNPTTVIEQILNSLSVIKDNGQGETSNQVGTTLSSLSTTVKSPSTSSQSFSTKRSVDSTTTILSITNPGTTIAPIKQSTESTVDVLEQIKNDQTLQRSTIDKLLELLKSVNGPSTDKNDVETTQLVVVTPKSNFGTTTLSYASEGTGRPKINTERMPLVSSTEVVPLDHFLGIYKSTTAKSTTTPIERTDDIMRNTKTTTQRTTFEESTFAVTNTIGKNTSPFEITTMRNDKTDNPSTFKDSTDTFIDTTKREDVITTEASTFSAILERTETPEIQDNSVSFDSTLKTSTKNPLSTNNPKSEFELLPPSIQIPNENSIINSILLSLTNFLSPLQGVRENAFVTTPTSKNAVNEVKLSTESPIFGDSSTKEIRQNDFTERSTIRNLETAGGIGTTDTISSISTFETDVTNAIDSTTMNGINNVTTQIDFDSVANDTTTPIYANPLAIPESTTPESISNVNENLIDGLSSTKLSAESTSLSYVYTPTTEVLPSENTIQQSGTTDTNELDIQTPQDINYSRSEISTESTTGTTESTTPFRGTVKFTAENADSTLPTISKFEVSPHSVVIYSANDLSSTLLPDDEQYGTTVSILSRKFGAQKSILEGATTPVDSESTTPNALSVSDFVISTTLRDHLTSTTNSQDKINEATKTPQLKSESPISTTTPMNRKVGDESGSTVLDSTPSMDPDYFVFAVLPNNTILRKKPRKLPYKETPFIIVGVYPNNTIVRKYLNGTVVPEEPVIQVSGFDTRANPPPLPDVTSNQVTVNPTTQGSVTPDNKQPSNTVLLIVINYKLVVGLTSAFLFSPLCHYHKCFFFLICTCKLHYL